MKILITGHKGFIGSNLFKFLKKKNKFKIKGFDYKINKSFPIIKDYDWVIHLGANSNTAEKNKKKIMKQNYYFSKKLLKECQKYNVNFQYASSASIYNDKYGFNENAKCVANSNYALTKLLFDEFVKKNKKSKIIIQGFRYFNVFGNNEKNKYLMSSPIYKFIFQATKYKKIQIFDNSDKYKRDFIYVGDVCKIHYKMLSKNISGIFNVGRGKALSFQSIANAIAKKYSAKICYIEMPSDLKKHYQKFTKADNNKIKKFLTIKFVDPIGYIKKLKKIYI